VRPSRGSMQSASKRPDSKVQGVGLATASLRPRIFKFGMGRSGTSWTAALLASAVDGHLIYEPYNWNLNPDGSPYRLRYVDLRSPGWRFDEILRERLRDLPRDRRPVVIKDVMTVLAMPYLHRRFGGSVVTLVRHPCAVASSWHALGWAADERIALLLQQADLMKTYLAPFKRHLSKTTDPWMSLGALWGALHFVMRRRFQAEPTWCWISYEWLCERPVARVVEVVRSLGFPMTMEDEVRLASAVHQHDRPLETHETPFQPFRSTATHAYRWRETLTDDQQARVLAGAAPFGSLHVGAASPSGPMFTPPAGP
jgi:hypothetical protein